jgi:hypothetical protein
MSRDFIIDVTCKSLSKKIEMAWSEKLHGVFCKIT